MIKGKITIEKGKSGIRVAPVLIALLLAGGLGFFFYRPATPPPFEISNFVGKPEIYSQAKGTWVPLERGASFGAKDKIRTGANSEVDLRMTDAIVLRLKSNSELKGKTPWFSKSAVTPLELSKGDLLGATDKKFKGGGTFEVSTPVLVAAIRGTLFQILVDSQSGKSQISVLRGEVEVRQKSFLNLSPKTVVVGNTQKLESGAELPEKAVRMTREDWNQLKETYELIQHSAAFEAKQIDLSKKAGNFFDFVFDQGTFFTEKFGYASREFMQDPVDRNVYLEVEYDVFPVGSVVGMYIKTRNLDISKFKALEFEARKNPDEKSVPDAFRMEFKFKNQIQRATSPKVFKNEWSKYQLLFKASKPTSINEVTLVFTHEQVGEFKKGVVQLRNFQLTPLDQADKAAAAAAAQETSQPAKEKSSSAPSAKTSESKPQTLGKVG